MYFGAPHTFFDHKLKIVVSLPVITLLPGCASKKLQCNFMKCLRIILVALKSRSHMTLF